MENPFGIVFPGEFTDGLGLRRVRPQWVEVGKLPPDVLPQQTRLFALERRPASFDDQLYAYLTEDEIAKYIGKPVRTTTLDQLIASISKMPFPGTMRRLGWLQREVGSLPLDTDTQIAAVHTLYGETVGELCARWPRRFHRTTPPASAGPAAGSSAPASSPPRSAAAPPASC